MIREGAYLADSRPMGETTVKTLEGRTATPSPHGGRGAPTRPCVHGCSTLRSPRRPRIWFEILLIAVSYWTYSLVRNAVPEQKAQALRNADWIWDVEHVAGHRRRADGQPRREFGDMADRVDELLLRHAALHRDDRRAGVAATVGIPGRYAAARLVLFATTGVALVGYYLYPLAPPRLMNGGDFIDTVLVHQTWGSMASGNLKNMSNQYAAMPSMHIGWSLWCGLTIFALAPAPWATDPRPALPDGHAGGHRRHGEPLLAGRGGRHDLPGVRLRGLVRLVRAAAAPAAEAGRADGGPGGRARRQARR